jgi:D-glycero-alpha-D-manno-heptose-7-phosphate kinase
MIITQTPFRMSFFGGGTDFKEFFEEHGGSVLATTFNKYCYVTVRRLPPFFEYKNQLTYSRIERTNSIDEIEHPSVREAMKFLDMSELRIVYEADLPARSGLGSSSAFAVGLLEAFYALRGQYVSKRQLAEDAIHLERELCGEKGGWQDQVEVAYGGLNRIDFKRGGFDVRPIVISNSRKLLLQEHLMLFFTGISRFSSDIAARQVEATRSKTKDLLEMKRLVDDAENILINSGDISEFGRLLDYTWRLKRGLTSAVSTEYIDSLYERAKTAGALGGKLLGSGGGGFLLFFAPPDRHVSIRKALGELLYVPCELENAGTSILYYSPEDIDAPLDIKKDNLGGKMYA